MDTYNNLVRQVHAAIDEHWLSVPADMEPTERIAWVAKNLTRRVSIEERAIAPLMACRKLAEDRVMQDIVTPEATPAYLAVRKLLADYLGARAQLRAIEEFAKLNVRPTGEKRKS